MALTQAKLVMMDFSDAFVDPSECLFGALKSGFKSAGSVRSIVDKVGNFLPVIAVLLAILLLHNSDTILEVVSTRKELTVQSKTFGESICEPFRREKLISSS